MQFIATDHLENKMAKTATFGVMHLVTSFSVTYGLTGSITIAGVVTFVEPTVNTIMHYFFDKYWDHPRMQAVRQTVAQVVRPGNAHPTATPTVADPGS